MSVTFTFAGTASSSVSGLLVTDVQRPILPTRRDVYADIPGRAGAWPFYEKGGDREIVVACAIAVGNSAAIRTSVATLAALLEQAGRQQLIFSDQSDRYWYARLGDVSTPQEQRGYATFDMTFRAEPYAYSTSTSSQVLGPTATEPYTTTFSVTTDADTPYQLDIVPSGATIPGFTMTVNGDALVYGGTVADGQTLAINSATYTVTNNGALSMATVSGTFGRLINGTNSITFDRTSGTASTTLTFTWRRRYL